MIPSPSSYQVIDLETSIMNRGDDAIGGHQASPYHPENRVVMSGAIYHDVSEVCITHYHSPPVRDLLMVGQNLKFDLQYLMHFPQWKEWILYESEGKIWDTMVVEYLIQGQRVKMPSLDTLAEIYGGTIKPDAIKEYWKEGIDTEDIPQGELQEYLIGDVENTELIFLQQWETVHRLGIMDLVQSQMEALVALTVMEWNGMNFDKELAREAARGVQLRLDASLSVAIDLMRIEGHPDYIPNPLSNIQLSSFLFGGEIKYTHKVQMYDEEGVVVRYKSGVRKGELKLKNEAVVINALGLINNSLETKVGDVVLKEYMKDYPLCSLIMEMRDMKKQIGTYFIGYSDLTWGDGLIHPSYLQARTDTGRLSCTKPNLQNVTSKQE